MERRNKIGVLSLALVSALALSMSAETMFHAPVRDKADVDTTRFFPKRTHEIEQSRKMMSSAFPVDIKLTGRALCIKSEYNQMLPVYSASGVLYMAMHLNKGTNWLNGLPKGHYFINSRPLIIP